MSKTLLRGLDLIEEVDRHGPLTIGELARRTGGHVSVVSRTVSACEPEGWLTRVGNRVVIGPRCALLGLTSPGSQAIRAAEPMVRALAGVTGLSAQAAGLIGTEMMVLTSFGADGVESQLGTIGRVPLYALAAGRAVAVQLSAAQLDDALPPEPYPAAAELLAALSRSDPVPAYLEGLPTVDPGRALPRNREELTRELEAARKSGFARDQGELHPAIHCIAVPWPTAGLPASFACFGTRTELEKSRHLVERCLTAAARPGAEPRDVVAAASD
jgi:DNA-binding IclR family transcriptional regulator